ncbi:MAG: hypothetical protein AAF830_05265 [Pseudomonadota bacterium]
MKQALMGCAAALSAFGFAHAGVTTYDNLADFTAAIGGAPTTSETFDNDIPSGDPLTFDSGVAVTKGGTVFGNRVTGGRYETFTDGDNPTTEIWTFPIPIIGFGMDVFSVNSSSFDGVQVTINDGSGDQTFVLFDILFPGGGPSNGDGFVGFTTMSAITSVVFTGVGDGAMNVGDIWSADNLVFAQGNVAPEVPVPAAALLFAPAALLAARRRKASA